MGRAYPGSDLVRGYGTWFGVSEVCAIVELRMLGVAIPESRLEQARRNEQARAARRTERKHRRERPQAGDGGPAFVAGYTPGGAPYGVEREEADAAGERAPAWRRARDEDEDLPF